VGLLCACAVFGFAVFGAVPPAVVFCHYNLENYVGEDQVAEGGRRARPKSEQEMAVLIRIISEIRPDILGVCEMGSAKLWADFQGRLAAVGLKYESAEYVDGPDPDRHLALLSRFPVVARDSAREVDYTLAGSVQKVRRGFLDVTVEMGSGYRLRVVGAHLKSKLAASEGEALIRRHEAHLLRVHLDGILEADPEVNLLCYGDFNEAKNEPGFQEIVGVRGSAGRMSDLWAQDALGDRWTHYWRAADLYSRIDYLLVSRGLWPEVVRGGARVYRGPDRNRGSDRGRWKAATGVEA